MCEYYIVVYHLNRVRHGSLVLYVIQCSISLQPQAWGILLQAVNTHIPTHRKMNGYKYFSFLT